MHVTERSRNRKAVTRPKGVDAEESGRMVAVQVLDDLVPEDGRAPASHRRGGIRRLALSQRAGEYRHGGLGLLVVIGHHADRMKAERVREYERSPGFRMGKESREHGAVQTSELVSNIPGRLSLLESGVEYEVVVRGLPSDTQRMGGQDNQADRPAGKRLHFHGMAERQ